MDSVSHYEASKLHFVLFPFMAQGHMIPMVDIGKLLARRGAIVTIVTTPVNAARFRPFLARARESGLPIRVVELYFPCVEVGLPEGCENYDMIPNPKDMRASFFKACSMLEDQVEILFKRGLSPRPSCIISDMGFPYTLKIASKFHVPRICFHGFNSFALLCVRSYYMNMKFIEAIGSDPNSGDRYFVLPGLPDEIEFTRDQIPVRREGKGREITDQIFEADLASFGVVVNSFQELEPAYLEAYKKARGAGKVWCIGPVSLCNEDDTDKAQRGNNALSNEHHPRDLINWLDSREPGTVIYACLGSLCNLIPEQVMELGLGLEASGRPFIWALRGNDNLKEVQEWIAKSGFEERIHGRGLVIRGWAPQVLILSHTAVGGFLTHCGWNSTLEGVAAGLPLMTWPLFGEQFCNEKLVVQVLRIGVRVGVERPLSLGEEKEMGVQVSKEDVKKGIDSLMEEGKEGQARRERARELSKLARQAAGEGGSSHLNLNMLIQDVMKIVATGR